MVFITALIMIIGGFLNVSTGHEISHMYIVGGIVLLTCARGE